MSKFFSLLAACLYLSFSSNLSASGRIEIVNKSTSIVDNGTRVISYVNPISVKTPLGTVPRLPYQVWVTYSDGKSEYRQTKWMNYNLDTEKRQADPSQYPIGSKYVRKGYVIGDNSTDKDYPISADIEVVGKGYNSLSNVVKAKSVPLTYVHINGDNRLTSNRDLAINEIISWDVKQKLYNYRDTYGLSTEGYKRADGWDSPDIKLKGHGSGHYMSALALAYASATIPAQKDALRKNIARMVNELRECQERTFVWSKELNRYYEARDFAPEEELKEMKGTWEAFDNHKKEWKKYGYGYLNAIPAHHPALIEMYRAYNNSDWVWAPYYSIHKQLAGLIDIATYIDDKDIASKALLIAKDMGLWVWNRMHYRTYVNKEGTQEERRSRPGNRYEMWNMYIAGEVGGIGESLARLSEMVSDSEEKSRLIEASNYFDSPAFFNPLSKNIDDIRTRHANQHIPMIVAALRSYITNNDPSYYNLSENFWNLIQGRYRYATGGVGNGEMFRQPYTQMLSMVMNGVSEGESHSNPYINETCCAYNLLKLTKELNCFNPDDARYVDYYERTLYNQIVGSLNPKHYQTTYQYAVGLNASKPWGNENPQSTCCGGTGSENHVKYQEATYFVSDNSLWVALYMPTSLNWKEKGIKIQQDCLWPAESSKITIVEGSGEFTMKLRVPYWATEGFEVKVNGKSTGEKYQPCSYAVLPNKYWKKGDIVEVVMPFTKHIDYGADKLPAEMAHKDGAEPESAWLGTLMYGPLAMTATDVTNWKEATLNIDSNLATVTVGKPSAAEGTEGSLYTLFQGGHLFQPDYYRHDHSTHYFRINNVSDPTFELKRALSEKINELSAFSDKNYTKKSFQNLKIEKRKAEKLVKDSSVTVTDISSAIDNINMAVEGLKSNKLNSDDLRCKIDEAQTYDAKLYTQNSYQELHSVIVTSQNLLSKSNSQKDLDRQSFLLKKSIDALVLANSVDKNELSQLIKVAAERKVAQEKWNALEAKVPEYAPWAKHGFDRMAYALYEAERGCSNVDKNYSQVEINTLLSNLNSAINTMRPGNLPEMEDIRPLAGMLRRAGNVTESTSSELKTAIQYSEMVIKYVADGSGTHDMIQSAIDRLRLAMK